MCNSWVDFYGSKKGCLIPVARDKCICLRLKECIYCLFISRSILYFPPFVRPSGTCSHLPAFSFSISPLFSSPLTPPPHNLSPSVSSSSACIPAMGYCFSNLADRGQYLCIVFQYPFLMLTLGPGLARTQKHGANTRAPSLLPFLVPVCVCVFNVLSTFSPLSPPPTPIITILFFLSFLEGK